jgi:uncharacterized protein YggE
MNRLAFAICLLFSGAAPVFAQPPAPPPHVIVAQGEATLKRVPDRAWLTIATEARDPRAAEARGPKARPM